MSAQMLSPLTAYLLDGVDPKNVPYTYFIEY